MGNAKQDYKPAKGDRKSRGGDGKPAKVSFAEFRFVRIELTEREKDKFRELRDSGEFEPLDIDSWMQQGYKFSASYDPQYNSVVVSLSAQYRDMPNAGLILTGRGGSFASAVAVLEYKDKYLAGDDGWLAAETSRGGSYSDIG